MQGIWTRIAKFRCSRNGSACFSSAAVIAPRSTAAPLRRRITRDDALAAFFSTVIFASTVADGKRKDARQQQCVREINHARSELNALKADQERRLSSLASAIRPVSDSRHDEPIDASPQTWQDLFVWASEEIKEREALGFEKWRGVPLDVLRNAPRHQLEDFLEHHSHLFHKFEGAVGSEAWETVTWPLYIKKIRTLEWSTARLALELMRHVPPSSDRFKLDQKEATKDVRSQLLIPSYTDFKSRLAHARYQLKRLEDGKKSDAFYYQFERPELPRYSVSQADDPSAAHQLNAKLYTLFESRPKSPDRITSLLPSICAYLLTSMSPPDIHTYNLLLLEFAGEQRNDLIRHVLKLIMCTHMRLNEITLTETLRYFVRTRKCSQFDKFVARMEGFGEGLGEAPPWLDIPDLLRFQYRVRVTRRQANGDAINEYFDYVGLNQCDITEMKRHAQVRVYEKSRRNLEVYGILIEGAMIFHGMPEAMRHYRTMISEGWSPNEQILLTILHGCLSKGDPEAGFATWRCLQDLGATISERGYMLMLQLCQMANQPKFISELLHHGIQWGVLPQTVLEMGWHKPPHHEKTHVLLAQLRTAKDVQTMLQKLEDLLEHYRVAHEVPHEAVERVAVLLDYSKRSVPYPNDKTVALLREAESFSIIYPKYSHMDTMLRESSEQILSVMDQLDAVQLFKKVQQLELQLQALSLAMTRTTRDASSIFFSACVTNLEDCIDQIAAGVTSLSKDLATLSIYFAGERLRARFYSIIEEARATHREIYASRWKQFSLVPNLLGSIGKHLSYWADVLNVQINRTSCEVKKTLYSAHEGRITFRQLDNRGYDWTYQLNTGGGCHDRPDDLSYRPSDETGCDEQSASRLIREAAAAATDALSSDHQPRREGVVKFYWSDKGARRGLKPTFRKTKVNVERKEEGRVKAYGEVRLDLGQIGAAQCQLNASDRLPPTAVKASDENGAPKSWVPNVPFRRVESRVYTQTYASGNARFPCPDLAGGLGSLSATQRL
ncbi:MAG: hypothetical protein LQ344_000732 [Seirophora lacunosa]|nr:MAG: hypothetical protein LQ344_000732 [Seirophora lacunosa]